MKLTKKNFCLVVALVLANGIFIYLMLSISMSALKAGIGDCGIVYPVDKYINTQLLCPEE